MKPSSQLRAPPRGFPQHVKSHLASIQQKLGLRNRVEIAAWAWETGLIDPAVGPRPR